jgi:hypothetical protein
MKWRNQQTGLVVKSDKQLGYPYVRIPQPFHKAVLKPETKVTFAAKFENDEEE